MGSQRERVDQVTWPSHPGMSPFFTTRESSRTIVEYNIRVSFTLDRLRRHSKKHFSTLIDLQDISSRPSAEQTNAFLTRAQLAFAFSYLAGVPADVAAAANTDGFGDNGIDGALYNPADRVLYVGQSKWRHDGSGSIDRGEIQKFIKGFRDLINTRWPRFNDRMKAKSADIEAALNDASTRIVLVVAYTGQEALSTEVTDDLNDLLRDVNNPTELVEWIR